jgi:hypothetical protein
MKSLPARDLRKTCATALLCLLMIFSAPALLRAADDTEALHQQMQELESQMQELQNKLDEMEKEKAEQEEAAKEVEERLNKAELHAATDKLAFGIDFRTRAESIHYQDILVAPPPVLQAFFMDYPMGFNGATQQQIQQAIGNLAAAGMIPPPGKVDADNDIVYTNRLRLDMNARVNSQLTFTGRLAAYKVFGDSTGVKVYQGGMGDVTFDGNTSSLPSGDTIHLERAYFNWSMYWGSSLPVNFSLGRRPATEGPPLEYRNYSLEGGSPLAPLINWQFDGASLNFDLEDLTRIPGAAFKICYGVGFESDWGNSSSLAGMRPNLDDVHMLGFIADLYNNDTTSVILNYAHASDVTDGFTGLTVMPFFAYKQGDQYFFEQNSGGYVSRIEPTTNIGDWDGATLLLRTNLAEKLADIDLFLAGSWSHTNPSNVSTYPYYELLGQGLLSSNGQLESHDGYAIYAGAIFPMPFNARLGIEYNWGSQYWLNFTGAEDSLVASKLAARGQVWEAYYIQPVYGRNFFFTLGGQYYDYDYTGSGNPVGEPVDIDEATSLDALYPITDKVWLAYLSATLRF